MKLFKTRKSILAAGLAVAVAASGAGVAFGFFTAADGASSGAGAVGTSAAWTVSNPLTTASSLVGGLVPGNGILTVTGSVSNPGFSSNQLVSVRTIVERNLAGEVLSSTTGGPIAGCLADWFVVANTTPGLPALVAGGGSVPASSTITMTNAAVDQSGCKNAVFVISMVASSSAPV